MGVEALQQWARCVYLFVVVPKSERLQHVGNHSSHLRRARGTIVVAAQAKTCP